jgi:VIT1/CCC1 family predicted Fe2+/Mn2+ transporter
MVSRLIHRYVDPTDSLGELLFGMIMALTLTVGARLLSRRDDINPHDLVLALIGCNFAWGVIDAVLYAIGSIFSRNQRVHLVRKLRQTRTEAEAMAVIQEEFGLEDEPPIPAEDRAAFHRVVLDMLRHAGTERAHLRRQDLQAAIVIVVLVTLTALPGVLPFVFIADGYRALETANAIQICLLFLIGYSWARHSGANPWRTGLAIVALGLVLVGVAVILGG